MKFLVLDDDIFFAHLLADMIQQYFNNSQVDILTHIDKSMDIESYDAFFLDIELNNENGFDYASYIHESLSSYKPIIFVTSHTELWKESFTYRPFWYIDKAHYEEELAKMFKELQKELTAKDIITIQYQDILTPVPLKNIIYIHKETNNLYIHTISQTYKIYQTLKVFSQQLNNQFIKINSGTIVNKNYIKEYNKKTSEIILSNNILLPVSRSLRKNIINQVNSL